MDIQKFSKILLVSTSVLALILELTGFISPGWVCLSGRTGEGDIENIVSEQSGLATDAAIFNKLQNVDVNKLISWLDPLMTSGGAVKATLSALDVETSTEMSHDATKLPGSTRGELGASDVLGPTRKETSLNSPDFATMAPGSPLDQQKAAADSLSGLMTSIGLASSGAQVKEALGVKSSLKLPDTDMLVPGSSIGIKPVQDWLHGAVKTLTSTQTEKPDESPPSETPALGSMPRAEPTLGKTQSEDSNILTKSVSIPAENSTDQADFYERFQTWAKSLKIGDLPLNDSFPEIINWLNDTAHQDVMKKQLKEFLDNISNNNEILLFIRAHMPLLNLWLTKISEKTGSISETGFNRNGILQAANIAGDLGTRTSVKGVKWTVDLGLWSGKVCGVSANEHDDYYDENVDHEHARVCESVSFSTLTMNHIHDFDLGGMATWNDLRVETVTAIFTGVIGVLGTVMTVKPWQCCLEKRHKIAEIVGVVGMMFSGALFFVPIARVLSINSELDKSFQYSEEKNEVHTPWAVVISGLGASLAFVTAGLLGFFIWVTDKQKCTKLTDDKSIVYTKDVSEEFANESRPQEFF